MAAWQAALVHWHRDDAGRIDDDIAPGDHFLDRDNLIKGVELEGHYLAKVARRLEVPHLHLWAPVRRHNLRAHSTEFVDLGSAG